MPVSISILSIPGEPLSRKNTDGSEALTLEASEYLYLYPDCSASFLRSKVYRIIQDILRNIYVIYSFAGSGSHDFHVTFIIQDRFRRSVGVMVCESVGAVSSGYSVLSA